MTAPVTEPSAAPASAKAPTQFPFGTLTADGKMPVCT